MSYTCNGSVLDSRDACVRDVLDQGKLTGKIPAGTASYQGVNGEAYGNFNATTHNGADAISL